MFRQIRWRLLATYLTVILLALAFLGTHLARDFETRYLAQVQTGLLAQARLIAVHVGGAVDPVNTKRLRAELQDVHYPSQHSVWIVDRARTVLAASDLETGSEIVDETARAAVRTALQGQEFARAGHAGGLPVIRGAVPIRVAARVVGAVYVSQPLRDLADQIYHVRFAIVSTIAVTVLWAGLVSFLLANRIAGPIEAMRRATARIAAGDLGQRVKLETRDELGDLARSFNYMAAELARVDAMRREFVADASHELRTPVANLTIAFDALRGGIDASQPSLAPLIEGIEREIERLRMLVESLLDLSVIESGGVQLHLVPTDLSEVVGGVVRSFAARAAREGITLVRESPARSLASACDPERTAQLLSSLVDNALKFTPVGGIVSLTVAERDGQPAIVVEDTGPGIPDADLSHVFDRFFKADRSRSGPGGAGLGLAIARRLAIAQGGEIIAENRREGGARFTVTLPRS